MKFGRYLTFLTLLISCGVAAGETSAPEASETFGVHADIANVVIIHSPKKNISYKSHSKKSAPFQPVIKPYIPVAGNHAKSARKILVAHVTQHEDFHPQFKPFFPAEKKHSGKMQLTSQSKSGFHPKIKLFVPAQHQYAMKVRTVKKHKQAAYHVAAKSTTAHGKKLAKQPVKTQVANNENQEIKQDIRVADDLQPMPMKYAEVIIKANKLQVALKNMDMPKAAAASTVEAEKKSEAVTPERKVDPILGKKIMADANLGGRMVGIKIPAAKPALKIITSAAVGVNPSAIKADTAVHAMFVSQTKKTNAKTVGMPIPANLQKLAAQAAAQTPAAPAKQKEKYFSSDKIDTQPPVKFVAGDLSKDEFYILGENDPVPEKLATNPETEMAILGGDENEAAKKIMEFKLAAIQAAKERAQKELAAREISTKVLEDLDFEEREAKANLAAAQKAMDDVKQLKKWHQETDTPIGEIVDNVGPAYKDSIVNSVVPDKIKPKEQIVAEKKGIIPIDQITISDEMVMPDGEIEVAANQPPQQDVNIQKQQPVKIQDKPLLHQNRTVAHRGKKAKPGDLKELAAEQINTAVLGIKSGYEKKKSRGQKTLVEKNALANDADKVKAQEAGQHVIDYEADPAERFTITESQEVIVTHAKDAPKAIAQKVEKNKNAKPVAVNLAKPEISKAVAENTVKANIVKPAAKHVAEKAVKPSVSKPAAKEIAKAKAVKLNPAKPAIVNAEKPEAAKPVAVNAIKPEAAKPAAANAIKLEAAKPAAVNPIKLEAVKPASVNAIKLEAAKPAAVPVITPDVAKPVNVSAAKPKIEKMKPVKKVEIITYSEHDMSKVMNDLEKVVWQQKKLKMKAAKENKAKKTVTAEKSSPDDLDELSSSEEM